MSYIKHNFTSGDVIYADDLNEMDEQIAANEEAAVVDATLSQEGKPADAKAVGDKITDLKADVSEILIISREGKIRTSNFFDKYDSRNTSGQYYKSDGSLASGQSANLWTTHPMFVSKGTYRFSTQQTFGVNKAIVTVVDKNGQYTDTIIGTMIDETNDALVNIPRACNVIVNTTTAGIKTLRFMLASEWNEPYETGMPMNGAREDEVIAVANNFNSIFAKQKNLFNVNDARNISGQYWDHAGYLKDETQSVYITTHPIFVIPGTYKFNAAPAFGANSRSVAIIDTSGNIIKMLSATTSDDIGTVTIDRACLISFNTTEDMKSSVVFCESSLWDGTYHAFSNYIDSNLLDLKDVEIDDIDEIRSGTCEALFNSIAPFRGLNQFNWRSAENTWGEYRDIYGKLKTGQDVKYGTSHLIYVKPNTRYKFLSDSSFGSSRNAVGIYNLSKEYIKTIIATLDSATNLSEFSVDDYCYVQINISVTYLQRIMFCPSADYPSVYEPYNGRLGTGDYLDLSDSVTIADIAFKSVSVANNLFDKDHNIFAGYYIDPSNSGALNEISGLSCQYIPFQGVGTYYLIYPKSRLGNNSRICAFGSTYNYIGRFELTLDDSSDNAVAHFTALESALSGVHGNFADIKYLGYTFANDLIDSVMFVKDTHYPETYVPYNETVSLEGITVRKTEAEFIEHQVSANLFNRWGDIIYGKRFNTSSSAEAFEEDSATISQFIPFAGTGTYWMYFPFSKYGSGSKILLLDKNRTKLRMLSVTKMDTSLGNVDQPGYITVSDTDAIDVAYLGYTLLNCKTIYGQAMFVKGDSYPTEYVPYKNQWDLKDINMLRNAPNTLYRKKVLFDGDSICQYSTDRSNRGAYARRIADNNQMMEYNAAVGGGTITAGLYNSGGDPRHWICRSIDTLFAEHPDAEYVILEGGTNDADLIGDITGGTIPAGFGAVSDAVDFSGNYDDETFCGAVESMFYKATTYWPYAKIGFVVAMKMGHATGTAGITKFLNRYAYFEKVMEICRKWGIPYIDLWNRSHMNPRMTTYYDPSMSVEENVSAGKFYIDGQHPAPAGYDYITPIIEAWMRTL